MSCSVSRCRFAIALGVLLAVAGQASADHYQKLSGSDVADRSFFGFDLAVSDGYLLSGTPSDETAAGSAYLIDLSTGTEVRKLLPPTSAIDDFFGFSTALDRSHVLVGDPGSPYADTLPVGKAYVYDRDSGALQHTLLPADSTSGDEFGFSMSVALGRAIIGAPAGGKKRGAAYIFDANTGEELHKLVGSDTPDGSDFGYSVGIGDRYAVVGAPGNYDTLGLVPGAAYVFDVATGTQVMKLQPTDSVIGDEFGWSVAVDGSLALIGSPAGGVGQGAAYLFDLETGNQLFKFRPDVRVPGDDFGYDVDLDGNRAVIGSPGQDAVFGKAFLFDALTGERLLKVTPHDLTTNDEFGFSVGLGGDRMVVASPRAETPEDLIDPGAAYVFSVPLQCGDFDRDNDVDSADMVTVVTNWTGAGDPGQFDRQFTDGDCDADGDVDSNDFTSLVLEWTGALAGPHPADATTAQLIYDPVTGEVTLDPTSTPSGKIIAFTLASDQEVFDTAALELPWEDTGSNTDAKPFQVGQVDLSLLGVDGPVSLGAILPKGLSLDQVIELLGTARFASALGKGGNLELVVVPEPAGLLAMLLAGGALLATARRPPSTATRSP